MGKHLSALCFYISFFRALQFLMLLIHIVSAFAWTGCCYHMCFLFVRLLTICQHTLRIGPQYLEQIKFAYLRSDREREVEFVPTIFMIIQGYFHFCEPFSHVLASHYIHYQYVHFLSTPPCSGSHYRPVLSLFLFFFIVFILSRSMDKMSDTCPLPPLDNWKKSTLKKRRKSTKY
jgi:hypothetical protein